MDMKDFANANRLRCTASDGFDQPLDVWTLSDWMTATVGEVGEAANFIKKMNRVRDGIVAAGDPPIEELRAKLAKELADAFCYLDLMAQAAGIDLEDAVIAKFNEVSDRIGYPVRLRTR